MTPSAARYGAARSTEMFAVRCPGIGDDPFPFPKDGGTGRPSHAAQSTTGRALRSFGLRTVFGITVSEECIAANPFGKPLLVDHPSLHFNISHAGEWVVCVVGSWPVGIDIEKTVPRDPAVVAIFYSDEERMELDGLRNNDEQLTRFYDMWTCKESFCKARGDGLHLFPGSFTVSKRDGGMRFVTSLPPNESRPLFRQYPIDPAYVLSACSLGGSLPDHVRMVDPALLGEAERPLREEYCV